MFTWFKSQNFLEKYAQRNLSSFPNHFHYLLAYFLSVSFYESILLYQFSSVAQWCLTTVYMSVYSCFLFFLTQVLYTLLCNFSTQEQVLERLIAVHKVFLPSLPSLLFNYCIALHYMDYINKSLFNQLPINRHLAVSINFIQVCFVFLELYLQGRF